MAEVAANDTSRQPYSSATSQQPGLHKSEPFNILSTYQSLLASDPLLTMPVAAIESLILLLSHYPSSTTSETLSLLSHHINILKGSVRNTIALSAGTDLFQRYLSSMLQSPQPDYIKGPKGARLKSDRSIDDFQAIRTHLISNARLFATRAREARHQIASIARQFVRDDHTVLTYGSSRVVSAVLTAAMEAGTRFKLVYVCDSPSLSTSVASLPSTLPKPSPDFPVAVIRPSEVAHALSRISLILLGAEGVVENGGIISGLGTYQLGVLANAARKPLYVCAESHKFVRVFPLSQSDVGGRGLHFLEGEGHNDEIDSNEEGDGEIDYTPPDLITALITESGVHTPSAVSEELIKIWY